MKLPKFIKIIGDKITSSRTILSILIFLPLITIVGLYLYQLFLAERKVNSNSNQIELSKQVEYVSRLTNEKISEIEDDLMIIADHGNIAEYVSGKDEKGIDDFEEELLLFSEKKQAYDQIRYIDETGQEIIRVDLENGQATLIDEEHLQNKTDRYYFQKTMALNEKEIYLSPVDLNVEMGEVEIPYKPMVRFATPIFDSEGNKKGIVIINYLADIVLNEVDSLRKTDDQKIWLINKDGYFLKSNNADDEWAFMFGEEMDKNISTRYPELWSAIQENDKGLVHNDKGMFAYQVNQKEDASWTIVALIFKEDASIQMKKLADNLELNFAVLAVLLFVISFFISNSVIKRKLFNKEVAKLKIAVDSAFNHIVLTDPDGKVVFANPAVSKLTGYQREEIIGKNPSVWGGLMGKEFYEKFWQTIKFDKKVFKGEIINRRKNGEKYQVILTVSPVMDQFGNVEAFIGVEEDITQRKEIEKLKSDFVSMASHELRTPMTVIKGMVSMIVEGDYGKVNKNLEEPLQNIFDSTTRLINLVNDLLDVSRIEAKRTKFELSEFSIKELAKKAVKEYSILSKEKNIELACTDFADQTVMADSNKIYQVLSNLINNAIKFTNEGSINIEASVVGNEFIKIMVTDTGVGIDAEDQKLLFGQFQQITSKEDKSRPKGTGLGLYISKQLINKMGGEMKLEKSEPGKGSQFSFTVPLATSQTAKKVKEIITKEAQDNPNQK